MSSKSKLSAIPVPAPVLAPVLAIDDSRLLPGVLALLLGAFIVFGVGFAHSSTIHDAAHDGRHALSFPCH